MESFHKRKEGGVLGFISNERISYYGIQVADIKPSQKELFFQLRTTLQFAHSISSRAWEICRRYWDNSGRIDFVEAYLVGPVVVKDGQVEPLEVLIDVGFDNGGDTSHFPVPGCSLEALMPSKRKRNPK